VTSSTVAHRVLWIGSGRFDGRIGDGNGQRTCGAPDAGIGPSAQADGTVRQLAAGGTRAQWRLGEATATTIVEVAQRVLWIGSGRFDGRIGDGDGPRACRGPDAGIEADGKVRPRGTGLVPPLVPTWYPLRVEKPQAQLPVAHKGSLPDLRISAPSGFARILVWARDATDFRPSMNGVGGACASRRTVWESSRERWRDGAGVYRTLGFRPPRVVARILAWARDATDFRPSINGVGGACASRRTVWESV